MQGLGVPLDAAEAVALLKQLLCLVGGRRQVLVGPVYALGLEDDHLYYIILKYIKYYILYIVHCNVSYIILYH